MRECNVLARPYAKAAFEYALEQNDLTSWQHFLLALSICARDAKIKLMLQSPEFCDEKAAELLLQLTEGLVPRGGQHFIQLVCQNKRVEVLANVTILFDNLFLAHQKQLHVDVTTAVEMQENETNSLNQVLSQRFKQAIHMRRHVKPAILGGAIVQIGDRIFDGSYLTQIKRLTKTLTM